MLNIDEILYRESRTAISLPKVDRRMSKSSVQIEKSHEICNNCDKSQNRFTQIPQFKIKKINLNISKNLLTLVLSTWIILFLTTQSEAKPTHLHHHHHNHHHHHHHHKQKSTNTMSEVNIFDLQCSYEMTEPKMKHQMTDKMLSDRLKAILLGCQDTLAQTKDLIEQYIKTMWSQNVEQHHETWKDEKLSWLHLNNVPLPKEFNKSINAEHLEDLKKVDWTDHVKVFEYIGRIYQRLERVFVGIQIINKWLELAEPRKLMNVTELDKSKALFTKVTADIRGILCQIRELFMEVSRDPTMQQDLSDISPIREQINMDDTVKLNHWLIYREYHNLIDYSQELLDLIIKKYDAKQNQQ